MVYIFTKSVRQVSTDFESVEYDAAGTVEKCGLASTAVRK